MLPRCALVQCTSSGFLNVPLCSKTVLVRTAERKQPTIFLLKDDQSTWRDHDSPEVQASNRIKENLNLCSQNTAGNFSSFHTAPCRRCIWLSQLLLGKSLSSRRCRFHCSLLLPRRSSGFCVPDVLLPGTSSAGNLPVPKQTPHHVKGHPTVTLIAAL